MASHGQAVRPPRAGSGLSEYDRNWFAKFVAFVGLLRKEEIGGHALLVERRARVDGVSSTRSPGRRRRASTVSCTPFSFRLA